MEFTIIYIVVILFLGVFCKNNMFTNILLAITLFILFAFERSDQDYMAYVRVYDQVGVGSMFELIGYEPSFFLFCTLGNNWGLSFDAARAIVCALEVLAIFTTIRIFTSQIACVIALFLIFPATADAELFRWLGGMSVVLFAMPYLIRGESIRDYIVYSALVLLATSIHTSCIFFLCYNLMYINDKKRVLAIVVVAFVVLFVTSQTSLLYKILAYIPIQESLNDKFQATGKSNIFGLLALTFREFFIFLIGYVTYCKVKKQNYSLLFLDGKFSIRRRKYSRQQMSLLLCDKLWYINVISIILIVISIYTPQVQRLFHVLLFFNTIAASYVSYQLRNKRLLYITILCVLITLLLHLFNGPQNMEIFMSHFNEGFLVNFYDVVFENKVF